MKFFVQICFSISTLTFVTSRGIENEMSCPENMIRVPGSENSSEQICDCKPRFLYHPESHSCHEAYTKGPCPQEHHFVLPSKEISAKCEKSPCQKEGEVHFQGSCVSLGENGPCEDKAAFLDVNEINFELECKPPVEVSFFSRLNVQKSPNDCPRGSRRIHSGKCKHVFQ